MDEKAGVTPSEVEKNVAGFDLKKVEVTLVGTVEKDKVLRFTARASKMSLELQNAEKAKGNLLSQIEGQLAETNQVKVSGVLREVEVKGEKEPKLVLELAAVEFIKTVGR